MSNLPPTHPPKQTAGLSRPPLKVRRGGHRGGETAGRSAGLAQARWCPPGCLPGDPRRASVGHFQRPRAPSLDTTETTAGPELREPLAAAIYGSGRYSLERRTRALEVAAALRGTEFPHLVARAGRMESCCTRWGVRANRLYPNLSEPVMLDRCRDRLCPSCNIARAARLADLVRTLLLEVRAVGRVPKFITLTQRARPGESLREGWVRLQSAFRRLRARAEWRRHVRAFVAAREVIWSRSKQAWHVHVHLVADADYWLQAELAQEWERVTGGESRVVDIREARPGTELELLKYTLKIAGVPAARLVEFALSMGGARVISTGGAWRGRLQDEDLDVDGEPEWEVLGFGELRRRELAGDGWACAVGQAIDRWIAERMPDRGS